MDSLRFRFFTHPHRNNTAGNKVIGKKQIYYDRMLISDASWRQGSSAQGCCGPQFYHSRGIGLGKDHLLLSRSSSSCLVSDKIYIQISWKLSSKSCPWSESEHRPHHIPHPMIWGNSYTPLIKQACLILMAFLNLHGSLDIPQVSLFIYNPLLGYLQPSVPTLSLSKLHQIF